MRGRGRRERGARVRGVVPARRLLGAEGDDLVRVRVRVRVMVRVRVRGRGRVRVRVGAE